MERRRSRRFGLAVPMDADVRVLQDVRVEQVEDNAITVLCDVPGIRGEELTLRFDRPGSAALTMAVRTASSEPKMVAGRLLHRVHLTVAGSDVLSATDESSWRTAQGMPTVAIRRHTARIVNLSRGGCLFELSTRLRVGTVATLERRDAGGPPEPVRINSLHERKGVSWPYAAGAEFLSLEPLSVQSLRALAGRMEAEEEGA